MSNSFPFTPKATSAVDRLTAPQLSQIYELARQKYGVVEAVNRITYDCRQSFGCEVREISIDAARYVIDQLHQLKDYKDQFNNKKHATASAAPAMLEWAPVAPGSLVQPEVDPVWGRKL